MVGEIARVGTDGLQPNLLDYVPGYVLLGKFVDRRGEPCPVTAADVYQAGGMHEHAVRCRASGRRVLGLRAG